MQEVGESPFGGLLAGGVRVVDPGLQCFVGRGLAALPLGWRLAFAGLRGVWILDNAYLASPSPVITQRYAKTLRPSVIFSDYGGYVVSNPPPVSFSDGVPVVHALWGDSVGNTVARVRASAAAYAGRPAFVLVALSTGTMSYAQARQVMDQLGPSFIAVRPDRFVGLIKGNSTPPAS